MLIKHDFGCKFSSIIILKVLYIRQNYAISFLSMELSAICVMYKEKEPFIGIGHCGNGTDKQYNTHYFVITKKPQMWPRQ